MGEKRVEGEKRGGERKRNGAEWGEGEQAIGR